MLLLVKIARASDLFTQRVYNVEKNGWRIHYAAATPSALKIL